VGLISSKDILGVMPELIEIIQERSLIEGNRTEDPETEETPSSGPCDLCGVYSENLKEKNGQTLCEDCRIETANEQ
jgi:Zn finger protein HypA/HybF involved in hydrogenase expression